MVSVPLPRLVASVRVAVGRTHGLGFSIFGPNLE